MVACTKLGPPQMLMVKPDPAITRNSLRVIAASEADGAPGAVPAVNQVQMDVSVETVATAQAVPIEECVPVIFHDLWKISKRAA